MELDGDVRVVPSSKRVTEDRWALVGLMRPDRARFGGCGVASSSFRRVAASSFLSSSRSARSCLNSSSRGAEAPAPMLPLGAVAGCAGLPLRCHGVGSMPFFTDSSSPMRTISRCAPFLRVGARVGLLGDGSGGDAEGRLAPHPTLPYSYATAWALNNLNGTRTQNACVECGLALCC